MNVFLKKKKKHSIHKNVKLFFYKCSSSCHYFVFLIFYSCCFPPFFLAFKKTMSDTSHPPPMLKITIPSKTSSDASVSNVDIKNPTTKQDKDDPCPRWIQRIEPLDCWEEEEEEEENQHNANETIVVTTQHQSPSPSPPFQDGFSRLFIYESPEEQSSALMHIATLLSEVHQDFRLPREVIDGFIHTLHLQDPDYIHLCFFFMLVSNEAVTRKLAKLSGDVPRFCRFLKWLIPFVSHTMIKLEQTNGRMIVHTIRCMWTYLY